MLTDKEIKQLAILGKKIITDLSEDVNGYGVPGKTCRLEAINNMIKYLKLHNYEVKKWHLNNVTK